MTAPMEHYLTLAQNLDDQAAELAWWVQCRCGWVSDRYATVTASRWESDRHVADVALGVAS